MLNFPAEKWELCSPSWGPTHPLLPLCWSSAPRDTLVMMQYSGHLQITKRPCVQLSSPLPSFLPSASQQSGLQVQRTTKQDTQTRTDTCMAQRSIAWISNSSPLRPPQGMIDTPLPTAWYQQTVLQGHCKHPSVFPLTHFFKLTHTFIPCMGTLTTPSELACDDWFVTSLEKSPKSLGFQAPNCS